MLYAYLKITTLNSVILHPRGENKDLIVTARLVVVYCDKALFIIKYIIEKKKHSDTTVVITIVIIHDLCLPQPITS